jgi:hypothetical protein
VRVVRVVFNLLAEAADGGVQLAYLTFVPFSVRLPENILDDLAPRAGFTEPLVQVFQ